VNDIGPRDARLRSQYYRPAQLLALGRIVELSSLLEVLLRQIGHPGRRSLLLRRNGWRLSADHDRRVLHELAQIAASAASAP
jgi:hypothetical protein